ncbi:aspartic protease 2B [Aphelenchoides avenae]|nr:aspartic protease 2B [Aphelenchus avenae]
MTRLIPEKVCDYNDIEYTANVSIGTPPQHFIVLLDLVTNAFWVPDKTCATKACPSYCKDAVYCKSLCDPRCCTSKKLAIATTGKPVVLGDCGWRNRFDSSKSRTYRNNGTHFRSIFAVDEGEGFIGIDTVTLGDNDGLVIPSQTFGQATTGLFTSDDAFDGVLGIGAGFDRNPGMIPPLVNAKQQGLVKHNMFTIALRRDGDASPNLPGGTITYGDVDTKNCGAIKAYIPSSRFGYQQVSLDDLSFGGFQSTRPSGTRWSATISFERTAFSGPKNVTDAMAKQVGAVAGDYFYDIACNATIPSLFLTLGGVQVEIPQADLIEGPYVGTGKCRLNIYGDEYSSSAFFSVGTALARKTCLTFDLEQNRIGISQNLYAR